MRSRYINLRPATLGTDDCRLIVTSVSESIPLGIEDYRLAPKLDLSLPSYPIRCNDEDTVGDGMASQHRVPCRPLRFAIWLLVFRKPADGGGIAQELGAGQCGQTSSFREPLVPADADTDSPKASRKAAKTEISGSEIELLVIGRIVGDVHLTIVASDFPIGIDHGRRIVVESRGAAFEEAGHNHDIVFCRQFSQRLGRWAWNRLGQIESTMVLRLAWVGHRKEFLQADNLVSLRGRLANERNRLTKICVGVFAAAHLQRCHLDGRVVRHVWLGVTGICAYNVTKSITVYAARGGNAGRGSVRTERRPFGTPWDRTLERWLANVATGDCRIEAGQIKERLMDTKRLAKGLFIVGIGTEVGKTFVGALIARALVARGVRVGVYKPVASGCSVGRDGELIADDAVALWEAAGKPGQLDHVCPQRFRAPVAPHRAAAAEGRQVDAALLRSGLARWQDDYDLVLVEGAGGLMSPLADDDYNADLADEFGFPLVVVAANRLGVINDTLQTLITAATFRDGLSVAGWVLNHPSPVSDESAATNRDDLKGRCIPPLLAEVPHGAQQIESIRDWMALATADA